MLRDPALVLVDLQKDFCRPRDGDGKAEADAEAEADADADVDADETAFGPTLDAVAGFLDRYRASGRTPILIRTTHDERSNSALWAEKYEGRERPMPCRRGTEGAEFVDAFDVYPSDVVVTKHRYNAFYGTDLETHLRSNGVEHLLVGGVNTNVCVASTVVGAFDRDYRVTLLDDCTATNDPELHEPTLRNVAENFGTVRSSDGIEL